MGIISTKCTNCGADLKLEGNREFAFCQYCGHKLIISSTQKIEHTTVIRNEADIIRANTEAKELELAEARRKKAARIHFTKKCIKYTFFPLVILILYLVISNSGTNYKLVNSTAHTRKAFNVTPAQLIDTFIDQDTKFVSEYGLTYTDWLPSENDEEYFTTHFNSLYHGEHRYKCYFYKPNNQATEPNNVEDERVYCYLYVHTDAQNRILYLGLLTMYRDETLSKEKELNGYFGTTMRGELFSILSSQTGDFVLKKFKSAENAKSTHYVTDGNIVYLSENESYGKISKMIITD